MRKIDFSVQLDARRWLPLIALGLALLLCLVLYWPGLNGPMLLDDFPQLGRFFGTGSGHPLPLSAVWWSTSGPLGRPVAMLSFWLNSVLTPDKLSAWKLTNLIIHLTCGLFAGLLAMELFMAARRSYGVEPRYLGAFVGIVWLLHPLQVSTVLYTVQRMTELAALFSFAGLFVYVRTRRTADKNWRQTLMGFAVFSLATILAALSKENGLLLPFLALAVEILLPGHADSRGTKQLIRFFYAGVCLAATLIVISLFMLRPHFIIGGYAFRGFTLGERLLSEPRILFDYLGMLLAPLPGHMGFFHDAFILSTGLLHPVTTLLSLLGLVALVATAWFARRNLPLYALGVAFFLIGQSMESSVIALRPMFEHRNYLPDFGIFLGLTELVAWVLIKRPAPIRTTLAGLVVLVLVVLLGIRVGHWSSELSLYHAAVAAHPNSRSARAGLAQAWIDAKRPERALRVLAGHPSFGAALQRAWIDCHLHGTLTDATLHDLLTQPFGHLDEYPVTGLTLLGAAGIRNQCHFSDSLYSQLIDRAAAVPDTPPGLRYMLYLYSAYYHQRLHQLLLALDALQQAHHQNGSTPVPLILGARWLLATGQRYAAENWVRRATATNAAHHAGFDTDIAELQSRIKAVPGKRPH